MAEAVAWAGERLALLGCEARPARRIHLVLDELYANTLLHGGEPARAGRVELAIERHGERLHLFYADSGSAFDTASAAARSAAPEPGANDHPTLGGAGLHLLQRLSLALAYRREGRFNRILVVMPRVEAGAE